MDVVPILQTSFVLLAGVKNSGRRMMMAEEISIDTLLKNVTIMRTAQMNIELICDAFDIQDCEDD